MKKALSLLLVSWLGLAAAFADGSFVAPTTNGTAAVGQLPGTTTNDNACVGCVGQIISSEILVGSAVSLSNNVAKDVTTISLTAGDWEVTGVVVLNPAGTTTTTYGIVWSSATANATPTFPNQGGVTSTNSAVAGSATIVPAGVKRFSLSGTQTVSLGVQAGFAISTMTAYGYIQGKRVR